MINPQYAALASIDPCPSSRALNRLLPSGVEMIPFRLIHAGFVATPHLPPGFEFLLTGPEADGETGKVPGTKRSRLGTRRDLHGYAEHVGLKLHEKAVARRPAVSTKLPKRDARFTPHCLHHVAGLIADGFQRSPSNVRAGCPRA